MITNNITNLFLYSQFYNIYIIIVRFCKYRTVSNNETNLRRFWQICYQTSNIGYTRMYLLLFAVEYRTVQSYKTIGKYAIVSKNYFWPWEQTIT